MGNLERLCGWGILKGCVDGESWKAVWMGNLGRLCGWGILAFLWFSETIFRKTNVAQSSFQYCWLQKWPFYTIKIKLM